MTHFSVPVCTTLDHDGCCFQVCLIDHRHLFIEPLTYGRARLGISGPYIAGSLEDQWEYLSVEAAFAGLNGWDPNDPYGREPTGWNRHPLTNRYRINGDPKSEYVKRREGVSFEAWMTNALTSTRGADRVLVGIEDMTPESMGNPAHLSLFPTGTHKYCIISKSSTCQHTPPCQWYETALIYLDRCVLLSQSDMATLHIGTILHRLKGDDTQNVYNHDPFARINVFSRTFFLLDETNRHPFPSTDMEAVEHLYHDLPRRLVGKRTIRMHRTVVTISTVFSIINTNVMGTPQLWETQIFSREPRYNGYLEHYHTYEQAEYGHNATVKGMIDVLTRRYRQTKSLRRAQIVQRRLQRTGSIYRR